MTASLIDNGRIKTTEARAKEVRQTADKMISLGKKGDLHSRRQALAYIYDKKVVSKLFDEVAPKYEDRNGGYTRILKLGPRRGDCAEMVIIELV
jgi:large subunit ribosomal protein L17